MRVARTLIPAIVNSCDDMNGKAVLLISVSVNDCSIDRDAGPMIAKQVSSFVMFVISTPSKLNSRLIFSNQPKSWVENAVPVMIMNSSSLIWVTV